LKINEFIRLAESEGWSARQLPGGHFELSHAEVPQRIVFSASPSDHRWVKNTLARMRRAETLTGETLGERRRAEQAQTSEAKAASKAKRRKKRLHQRDRPVRIEAPKVEYLPTPPPPIREGQPYDPTLRKRHTPGAPTGYFGTKWGR
jgi:hypothetical protein